MSDISTQNIPKPITVAHAEFMGELVKVVNDSQLPFFIVESSLKEFISELHDASIKQLDADKMKYSQQLALLAADNAEKKGESE